MCFISIVSNQQSAKYQLTNPYLHYAPLFAWLYHNTTTCWCKCNIKEVLYFCYDFYLHSETWVNFIFPSATLWISSKGSCINFRYLVGLQTLVNRHSGEISHHSFCAICVGSEHFGGWGILVWELFQCKLHLPLTNMIPSNEKCSWCGSLMRCAIF